MKKNISKEEKLIRSFENDKGFQHLCRDEALVHLESLPEIFGLDEILKTSFHELMINVYIFAYKQGSHDGHYYGLEAALHKLVKNYEKVQKEGNDVLSDSDYKAIEELYDEWRGQ